MNNKLYLSSILILFCGCPAQPDKSPFSVVSGSGDSTEGMTENDSSSSGSSDESSSEGSSADTGNTETEGSAECSRTIILLDKNEQPAQVNLEITRYGIFIGTSQEWFEVDFVCENETCLVPCFAEEHPDKSPDILQIIYSCSMTGDEAYTHWNLNDQPNDPYIAVVECP